MTGQAIKEFVAAEAGSIEKHPQHLAIDTNIFNRVLMIRTWPDRTVFPGFMAPLYQMDLPEGAYLRIVYRFQPAKLSWNWKMNWKLRRLESKIAGDRIPDPSEVKALKALQQLQGQNLYQGSGLFDAWCFICIQATQLDTLDTVCQSVIRELIDQNMQVHTLNFEQVQALQEVLALGQSDITFLHGYPGRIVQEDAAGALIPFLSGGISDDHGIYIGHSVEVAHCSWLDLESGEENKNFIILGTSGEGKSTFLKALVTSLLEQGFLVIVFDLDGEYRQMVEAYGGLYVDLTLSSGRYIDPLLMQEKSGFPEDDSMRLTNVADTLFSVVSILCGGITSAERNAADRALQKLYDAVKINPDDDTTWDSCEYEYGIQEWYSYLQKDTSREGKELSEKLRIYFTGSYKNMFGSPEKVDVTGQSLICFQVAQAVEKKDSPIGAAKMTMALSLVRNILLRNKLEGKRYSAVLFDEGQRLLLDKEASGFVNILATTIRRWNGLIALATNKPQVLWLHQGENAALSGGTGLWANSKYKVLFWLEDSEIKALAENADVPTDIISILQRLHGTKSYLVRHADRGYDHLRLVLPPEEARLYRTRGLNNQQ